MSEEMSKNAMYSVGKREKFPISEIIGNEKSRETAFLDMFKLGFETKF